MHGKVWKGGIEQETCVAGGMCGKGRVYMDRGKNDRGCEKVRVANVAGETATAADCTHPTGMHSCYYYIVF